MHRSRFRKRRPTRLVLSMTILVMLVGASANPPGVVDLPPVDELPVIEGLPDPFMMNDGTRVATKEDWAKRRKEIKACGRTDSRSTSP